MSSRHSTFFSLDFRLLIPALVLVLISLTTLFSIDPFYFRSQLTFFILSLFVFFIFSHVHPRVVQLYGYPIYIISLILLIIVLLVGIESRGAVRWLDIFGLRIQFSEILKPFLAISFATFIASRAATLRAFLLSGLFLIPVCFLILVQPDLGSALIYALASVLTLLIVGFPLWWFGAGFVAFLACMPVAWHFLHDYQRQRLTTFINPTSDPLGTSYNSIQAIIAVGSGMFFGKGLNERTQSGLAFLPEHHTDFIFATISEGLGFVGALAILVTFCFLLYRIYTICVQTQNRFCKMYAAFAFSFILIQFFVNIGMNIGIVPVVGITLPFVSYGGSSLLSNFILLGFLSSISTTTRDRDVLEIR